MISDLFNKVYKVVREIPAGRVTNYGAIAKFVGSPQASRMVGYAMNGSHTLTEFVPAHRVVNRLGLLTGKHHFGGPNTMQELLESEGAIIENDKILNFSEIFWDPNRELL
ncbi:MAG: MGMT family protein [Salinivirgaceae bacterium]|jgi:methylated-DNA-protein-cysteine methyltransferase-like protein|nr:MGMT family protein [Salinivirgaceae bacterium]